MSPPIVHRKNLLPPLSPAIPISIRSYLSPSRPAPPLKFSRHNANGLQKVPIVGPSHPTFTAMSCEMAAVPLPPHPVLLSRPTTIVQTLRHILGCVRAKSPDYGLLLSADAKKRQFNHNFSDKTLTTLCPPSQPSLFPTLAFQGAGNYP